MAEMFVPAETFKRPMVVGEEILLDLAKPDLQPHVTGLALHAEANGRVRSEIALFAGSLAYSGDVEYRGEVQSALEAVGEVTAPAALEPAGLGHASRYGGRAVREGLEFGVYTYDSPAFQAPRLNFDPLDLDSIFEALSDFYGTETGLPGLHFSSLHLGVSGAHPSLHINGRYRDRRDFALQQAVLDCQTGLPRHGTYAIANGQEGDQLTTVDQLHGGAQLSMTMRGYDASWRVRG
ncbi:MAG TPA: hypothetical protein VF466_00855 [Candidatus Saccharimonadales bacterium]